MTDQETVLPSVPDLEPTTAPWPALARVIGVVLVVGAVLGGAGGWLWYQWWGPPNKGSIYDTTAYGIIWLDFSDEGIAHEFAGTAQYAVVAFGLGLVLGVLAAVIGRRHAFVALGGLLVASAVAAVLCSWVGSALSPVDPQTYATEANLCTQLPCKEYPAAIEVNGWTAYLLWPAGALVGFCIAIVLLGTLVEVRRQRQVQLDAGTWLEREPRA